MGYKVHYTNISDIHLLHKYNEDALWSFIFENDIVLESIGEDDDGYYMEFSDADVESALLFKMQFLGQENFYVKDK